VAIFKSSMNLSFEKKYNRYIEFTMFGLYSYKEEIKILHKLPRKAALCCNLFAKGALKGLYTTFPQNYPHLLWKRDPILPISGVFWLPFVKKIFLSKIGRTDLFCFHYSIFLF
jgi:hypothetical protein